MSTGNGVTSQVDTDALREASGATASTLFLTQMIQHFGCDDDGDGGTEVATETDPRADALARSIVTGQTAEIAELQQLGG